MFVVVLFFFHDFTRFKIALVSTGWHTLFAICLRRNYEGHFAQCQYACVLPIAFKTSSSVFGLLQQVLE